MFKLSNHEPICFCSRAKAVKIIDPDTGVAVGPNVVGEITYKSDYPMLGYLNHPEENKKFFGKDRFLHSGDLGHYDEAGNMYFDGRLKELIKYKNFHLYPNELEEIMLRVDGVEDAAVFGRPEPSVQELVTALVTTGHLYLYTYAIESALKKGNFVSLCRL